MKISELVEKSSLADSDVFQILDNGTTNMKALLSSLKSYIADGLALSGSTTAETPAAGSNNTRIATTAFVNTALVNRYNTGDVITTSTNTNPSSIYGGAWTLIGKDFKGGWENNDNSWFTANSDAVSTVNSAIYRRYGKDIYIRLSLTTNVALSDTGVTLGTFNWQDLGATSTIGVGYTQFTVGTSDGGNGIIMVKIQNSTSAVANVFAEDVITKTSGGTIASGSTIYIEFMSHFSYGNMDDDYCDVFYWRKDA